MADVLPFDHGAAVLRGHAAAVTMQGRRRDRAFELDVQRIELEQQRAAALAGRTYVRPDIRRPPASSFPGPSAA